MMRRIETKLVWNGREMKIQAKEAARGSAYEIGLAVESQAKLLCPVRYGYLAASITTQAYNKGTNPESPSKYGTSPPGEGYTGRMKVNPPVDRDEVYVGTAVEYAVYVEMGTHKQSAQPFLRPALDLVTGKALTIVQKEGKYHFRKYLQ